MFLEDRWLRTALKTRKLDPFTAFRYETEIPKTTTHTPPVGEANTQPLLPLNLFKAALWERKKDAEWDPSAAAPRTQETWFEYNFQLKWDSECLW